MDRATPSRSLLGWCVLVRLAAIAGALRTSPDLACGVLGDQERRLWSRGATGKRRVEFLGGRLAGKLALVAASGFATVPLSGLAEIQILPDPQGAPLVRWAGHPDSPLSISHSTGWAVAVASVRQGPVAVDLEDAGSRVRAGAGLFHVMEEAQLRSVADARLRWTVKEAWGKFTGQGIQELAERTIVLRVADRLWLAVAARRGPRPATIAAGGTSLTMALAIGGRQS